MDRGAPQRSGTNAVFAFEAAAGVHVDAGITTTEDIDLLFDSRAHLTFIADDDVEETSLLRTLQRADTSFERSAQAFRAISRNGYVVDLIKPLCDPPWAPDPVALSVDPHDLEAVDIYGLQRAENATLFQAVAIDQRGEPVRIVRPPGVRRSQMVAVQASRSRPLRRNRDAEQAKWVAALVAGALTHLPYRPEDLRMLPKAVFDEAALRFTAGDAVS